MSLDYDITLIPEEIRTLDGKMNPITQNIIFTTMSIEMGVITHQNWHEFYKRTHAWELVYVATNNPPNFQFLTPEDIHNHITLKTNVVTRTRATLSKKLNEMLDEHSLKELGSFADG